MRINQPALIVLMYHRILPKSDPRYRLEQPGMIVEPDTFSEHLGILHKHFNLTSIAKWINTPENERPMGISCAISFDDGWSDNYTYAYPHLKRTKTPATIFLVTDLINTHNQFWPERLASLLHSESHNRHLRLFNTEQWSWLFDMSSGIDLGKIELDQAALDIIINNCKSLPETVLYQHLDAMEAKLPQANTQLIDILDWEQIHEMLSGGLIDFGSHTCSHTRMSKVTSRQQLTDEIVCSRQILERELGRKIDIFCYPNGDISPEADELVRMAYKASVTTRKGVNYSSSDPHLIKRISIHQDEAHDRIALLGRISKFVNK